MLKGSCERNEISLNDEGEKMKKINRNPEAIKKEEFSSRKDFLFFSYRFFFLGVCIKIFLFIDGEEMKEFCKKKSYCRLSLL